MKQSKAHSPTQIIALAGKKYSGKDTVVKMLQMDFDPSTWEHVSTSAFLMKRLAEKAGNALENNLTAYEVERDKQAWREALQKMGDHLEAQEPAFVMKQALAKAKGPRIILESVRRASEYEYLKMKYPHIQFILVEANDEARRKRGCLNIADSHVSEHEGLEAVRKDPNCWIINNNGTESDLKAEIHRFTSTYARQVHLI